MARGRSQERSREAFLGSQSGREGLLHAGGEDIFSVDFDFDAERGPEVGTLDDGSASEDVAGELGIFKRIEKRAAARVTDHGMPGLRVAVVGLDFLQVVEEFELTGTERGLHGERPVSGGLNRGAGWQAKNERVDILTG